MTLNGILYGDSQFRCKYCSDALDSGALAAGLSGTGPSFVAIVPDDALDRVQETWSSYPGRVILTSVENMGTRVVDHG